MPKKENTNFIKLDKNKKEYMLSEIKTYFSKDRNEDIGDLSATLVLDFILEKLAPEFYNQGIIDANCYMQERLEDMLGIQK